MADAITRMMSTLDEIKRDLSSGIYLRLTNELKAVRDARKLVRVTYKHIRTVAFHACRDGAESQLVHGNFSAICEVQDGTALHTADAVTGGVLAYEQVRDIRRGIRRAGFFTADCGDVVLVIVKCEDI